MSELRPKINIVDRKLLNQRDYWLKQLSGELPRSNLKLDYDRSETSPTEPETIEFSLSQRLYRQLTGVSGTSQFLLYRTLIAGLQVCLHKHTLNKLLVVGSPPRKRKNVSSRLPNAVAILSEVNTHISFKEFLVNVRETLDQAYKNEDYPFERLLRDLKMTQPENRCALFDVSLALTNIHADLLDVKNDIAINLSKDGGIISGSVTYNSLLFMRDSIERFISQFETALGRGLENPEILIGDLEILPDPDRRQMLVEWNRRQKDYPNDRCIHELFESQAGKTPDSIALEMEGRRLTYQGLNRAASKLALYLKAHQVGPEVVVGICVERSLEMIIGILGVLKAGGAFLPLDPGYPASRLEFMLEDSTVQVLLTQQRFREGLPGGKATIICLDSDWPVIEREVEDNMISGAAPDNLAYVIYTSGSTGQPKGVLLQHRGVCNLAAAQAETFDVQPDNRVLQFASLSFDASVSEIFMALTTGAALDLGDKNPMAGAALFQLLSERAISVATIPPAVLSTLPGEDLPALQTLIVAGESCPSDLTSRWFVGRHFFNAYGPTETTVCASIFECIDEYRESPPIGRPMANMQIYLLDSRLNPVPIGAPGEIYIGGIGVARGYFDRSGLTGEKFIPDPFSGRLGARFYRTGDLACYMFDGTIQYLGRLDHQVKIRGIRIELGEIEFILSQHPAVRDAVAVVREDFPGDKRLIAYVTSDEPPTSLDDELRLLLIERAPEYMMPSAIVMLKSLPLTPNGKVDRRELPAPAGAGYGSQKEFVAARNPLEEEVRNIWVTVLGVEQIGVENNFFEFGGNSLLATQIMSRVHAALKVELPLRALFEAPTIAGMAATIARMQEVVENENVTAQLLSDIEQLSEEEAAQLLLD
jgi:amino acid adenylation domain-containing protein